jgi:hypothetical protein
MDKSLVETAISNVIIPSNVDAATKLAESADTYEIKGYDLNKGIDYNKILSSYLATGFQATNFGKAVNEINRMVS